MWAKRPSHGTWFNESTTYLYSCTYISYDDIYRDTITRKSLIISGLSEYRDDGAPLASTRVGKRGIDHSPDFSQIWLSKFEWVSSIFILRKEDIFTIMSWYQMGWFFRVSYCGLAWLLDDKDELQDSTVCGWKVKSQALESRKLIAESRSKGTVLASLNSPRCKPKNKQRWIFNASLGSFQPTQLF